MIQGLEVKGFHKGLKDLGASGLSSLPRFKGSGFGIHVVGFTWRFVGS